MKVKIKEFLTVLLFCGFLGGMMLCYLMLPKQDFSETEKRYLAEAPAITWESISEGEWGDQAETYMADHIPGRNFFVGMNAYFELLTGRQVSSDVWLRGDRIVEAPVTFDESAVQKKMETVINPFVQKIGQQVDMAIIPSAGWAMGQEEYLDHQIIEEIYALAGDNLVPVDMRDHFSGRIELYYKTDHHWNSQGAYTAYEAYMKELGRTHKDESSFVKKDHGTFRGSTYSRSALWLTPAEELELWHSDSNLTVTNGETEGVHEGVYYYERLEETDKYTVFLDGNHSIVRISNPGAQGKLLVIRDSFSNSLGCFLAESFAEVVLIDLRYYKQPVSDLVERENFDEILICYSIDNFLTDVNLSWLR